MNATFDTSGILLETERLIIRAMEECDFPFFHRMSQMQEVAAYSGWECTTSAAESRERFERHLQNKETFVLILKADGSTVGTFSLQAREWPAYPIDQTLRGREFGFDLLPEHWGKGLMKEAIETISQYCFQTLEFDFVTAGYFPGNTRSCRLIEKCGFSYLFTYPLRLSEQVQVSAITYILYNPH